MAQIRVSEPIAARVSEMQSTLQSARGRMVTVTEVLEILFRNYDDAVAAENQADADWSEYPREADAP